MRNDPNKLKVRVVMKPGSKAERPSNYRYHWGRIALLIGVVLLVGGLFGSNFFSTPSDDAVATPPVAEQAAEDAIVAEESLAEADEPGEPVEAIEPEQEPAELAQAAAIPEPVAEQAQAVVEPVQAAPAEPIAEPETKQVVEPVAEAKPEPAARPEPAASGGQLTAGENRILSAKVKRFQLAAGVRDKEPRGSLQDVTANSNGLMTVYAFADVVDSKDQVLYYRWLRNGKRVANVEIGVWSNRWRSHSSKYISGDMRGEWQVRLENNKGELLAETAFRY